jgi:hypothetical protein
VRLAAVEALVAAGVDHGALPGLLRALALDDGAAAAKAQQAIRKARLTEDQVRSLGEALRAPDAALRLRVLALLEALDGAAAPALPGLRAVLRGGPGQARARAVGLLYAIGRPAAEAGPDLVALLADADAAVRLDAAVALAQLGEHPAESVPVLIAALRVERPGNTGAAAVRDRAAQALVRVGKPAVKPLVAALTQAFADRGDAAAAREANAAARLAVVETLGRIGPDARTPEALAALHNVGAHDSSFAVRDATDAALKNISE